MAILVARTNLPVWDFQKLASLVPSLENSHIGHSTAKYRKVEFAIALHNLVFSYLNICYCLDIFHNERHSWNQKLNMIEIEAVE